MARRSNPTTPVVHLALQGGGAHGAFTWGVDTLELSTDDDLAGAIMRFTDLRKQRSRRSGAAAGRLPAHLARAG